MGEYAPSSYNTPLERSSGAYGSRTSLLNIQVFVRIIMIIIIIITIITINTTMMTMMMLRKPQSQRGTCNRPPPPQTSATLAWQVSLTLAGDYMIIITNSGVINE